MEILINNFDYQEKALYTEEKYSCFIAGRQTGKTQASVNWIIENLLEVVDTGLWVDVRNVNIEKYVERYFKPILKNIWKYCDWNKQKKILTLPNGSLIDFGSAEAPEALEGFNYGFVVINEAGLILKNPNLWYNTILPMTKRAKVRFVGTPKGKNLFHVLTKQYETHKISAYDSPLWTKEQLDEIRTKTPEMIFRQEFLAEFLESEGTVFRGIRRCVKNIPQLSQGIEGRQYMIGVDLAKFQDFTVIVVIDMATKEVVHFDRFNQLDWNFQKAKIFSVWDAFNRGTVILDSTGVGSPIYDELKVNGMNILPYQFTNATKKVLIENLMIMIESEQIAFPDIPELIDELEVFEINITPSGNVTYSAPEGLHDDCVISLSLACIGLKQNFEVKTYDIKLFT